MERQERKTTLMYVGLNTFGGSLRAASSETLGMLGMLGRLGRSLEAAWRLHLERKERKGYDHSRVEPIIIPSNTIGMPEEFASRF